MKYQVIFIFLLAVVWTAAETNDEVGTLFKTIFGETLASIGSKNINYTRMARQPRAMRTPDSVYKPCKMVDGQDGRCVPYYFCPNPTTTERGGIDIVNPERDDPCEDPRDVCCIPPSKLPS